MFYFLIVDDVDCKWKDSVQYEEKGRWHCFYRHENYTEEWELYELCCLYMSTLVNLITVVNEGFEPNLRRTCSWT